MANNRHIDPNKMFDFIDFSKPDRYIKEIVEFIGQRYNLFNQFGQPIQSPQDQLIRQNKFQGGSKQKNKEQFHPRNLSCLRKLQFNQMNGTDAQIMVNELLKIMFSADTYKYGPPEFKPEVIQNLFKFLQYPYQVRADAITAVGAPYSISYLIKAIYWLFILAKLHTEAKLVFQEKDQIEDLKLLGLDSPSQKPKFSVVNHSNTSLDLS